MDLQFELLALCRLSELEELDSSPMPGHSEKDAFIQLEAGQVFDIRPSLAIYLLAMHCAEPVKDSGGGDDPR